MTYTTTPDDFIQGDQFPTRILRRIEPEMVRSCGIGNGWLTLVIDLDKALVRAGYTDYTILQIKEKFGGLRFYVGRGMDDNARRIISIAEELSNSICEICGEPGDKVSPNMWVVTRCKHHIPAGRTVKPFPMIVG